MKRLERTLDLWSVVAVSIAAMLGSGIFVLPGLAMAKTGPSVWLAYLAAGLCVLPAALSTSELATAMPTSGGNYFYLDRTFGPLVGTVSGIGLWCALLLKSAFALVGFGMYLAVIVDLPAEEDLPLDPTKLVALALLVGIVALNVLGVRKVSKVLAAVVAVSIVGLICLVAAGPIGFDAARLDASFPQGILGFLAATGFIFVSYDGVTKVAAIAEEIKNPRRNLPLGILISLGIVALLYGSVVLILVGNVPAQDLQGDLHPIYLLAKGLGGPAVGIAAALLAVLTMTSMANAGLLAASRFPFAMSRDNLLPAFLSVVHGRFLTPVRSIVLSGAAMAAVILLLEVDKIAKLASAFLIMMFIAVNGAVVVLRESDTQWYRPSFRTPLYPGLQVFGILSGLVLLVVMGWLALLAAGAIALPGAAVYFFYGRPRTTRRSVIGKISTRIKSAPASTATTSAKEDYGLALGQASVVVALLGTERSPETVVEAGAALGWRRKVCVVHITEVPEQMNLDAALDSDLAVSSLERRLKAMAQEEDIDLEFNAIVSRDFVGAVHHVSEVTGCDWVLKAWRPGGAGSVLLRSPLAWSLRHLPCNLALFKDAGVRYIRQIMVFAEPGPHDALVVSTADHLAQIWGAELTFARFVPDDATQAVVQSQVDYIDELRHLCQAKAHHRILRGANETRALVDATAGYDLLVLGAPEEGFIRSQLLKARIERLTEQAACSVLRLQTSRVRPHATFDESKARPATAALTVFDFIDRRHIQVGLEDDDKDDLFDHFSAVFAKSLKTIEAKTISDALWARERMQNTSIGEGLALPHGTLDELDRSLLGVFTTEQPVDYQAPGGEPVQVFFVTLGPPSERQVHLKLLSNLSRLVQQTDLIARLRAAPSPDAVVDIFRDCCSRT